MDLRVPRYRGTQSPVLELGVFSCGTAIFVFTVRAVGDFFLLRLRLSLLHRCFLPLLGLSVLGVSLLGGVRFRLLLLLEDLVVGCCNVVCLVNTWAPGCLLFGSVSVAVLGENFICSLSGRSTISGSASTGARAAYLLWVGVGDGSGQSTSLGFLGVV